jgi:predicted TPR repeat methyltransferase
MPQDLLQIGLEHHRNGRLLQADSSYRAALQENPADVEAMHWLGVLLTQAGQWKEAIHWLEQASAIRPADAAIQHNLGQAFLSSAQYDQAVSAFETAAFLSAMRAETRFSLGLALLGRRAEDDAPEAVIAFEQAHALGLDTPEVHRQLGAAFLATNAVDEAISSLNTAIKKHEDAPSRYLLAMAYQRKGDTREVRKSLLKALEINDQFARGWAALAGLEQQSGNFAQAAAFYRRALVINPNDPAVHQAFAHVLAEMGHRDEATAALKQAVRASRVPADSETGDIAALERRIKLDSLGSELHYTLATITNLTPPAQIPAALLTDLFDRYAADFDDHLRGKLKYTLPEKITDAIAAVRSPDIVDVLDLGCGTGLCGPLLRPWARLLSGVDISPGMIEMAKARKIYDTLEVSDLVEAMRKAKRAYDLLVAADVLLYIGDLSGVFEAAAACLRPGGIFAYSVEAGGGDRYHLQAKSKRFAHSIAYLQKIAAMYGFVQESFESVTARLDAEKPVPAYLAVVRLAP